MMLEQALNLMAGYRQGDFQMQSQKDKQCEVDMAYEGYENFLKKSGKIKQENKI